MRRGLFRLIKNKVLSSKGELKSFIPRWLEDLGPLPEKSGKVVLTCLRNPSWIDWAAYAACMFRKRGFESTLLYRSSEISRLYQSGTIDCLSLIPGITLLDIDKETDDVVGFEFFANGEMQWGFLDDSLAYDFHVERENVQKNPAAYQKAKELLRKQSLQSGKALLRALGEDDYRQMILYSGLIAETPMLLQIAKRSNLEVVCVEGWAWRSGHMIYNLGQPALEYNIEGWINHYGWSDETSSAVDEYLAFQDGKSKTSKSWLSNFYNVQRSSVNENLRNEVRNFVQRWPKSFILAPNVIGDSSTLNRETIFSGIQSWIREVIEFFRVNKEHSLIIRAHPAEEWVSSKVAIKLGEFALEYSKGLENVLVIDGKDKINSFSLLPYVKCGLVWISSIGVDLTVRGVPVICAGRPKFSGMGIAYEPGSKREYFHLLDLAKNNELPSPNNEMIENGKKYIHAVFKGFSFPAHGSNFRADKLSINKMPQQHEHDRFYDIILGIEPMPDREKGNWVR
jgi:hypothetical protein